MSAQERGHLFFGSLGSLGKLVYLMFPPEWGTTTTLLRFLKSLGETVAIAMLGTLLAAVVLTDAQLRGEDIPEDAAAVLRYKNDHLMDN